MNEASGPAVLRWFKMADRLLLLRGMAALAVIAYHAQDAYRATLRPIKVFGFDFSWLFLANGGMAVRVFFALSGFLMFKAFYTNRYGLSLEHLPKFYVARFRRIVPLYLFLTIVFVVLVYPILLRPEHFRTLASILTFTYSGNAPVQFAVPFWSLSTEVQFYLLVPLLVLLSKRIITKSSHLVASFAVVIALGVLFRWLTLGYRVTTFTNFITNVDIFLIGSLVCVGLYGLNTSLKPSRNVITWLSLIAGLLIFPVISFYEFVTPQYGYLLFAPTLTAILTCIFIWGSERTDVGKFSKSVYHLTEVARQPALWPVYVGALSYGIYLWHAPILAGVREAGLVPGTGWRAMIMSFAITAGLAIVCSIWTYKFIENRAR